jgi:hypothetical protein
MAYSRLKCPKCEADFGQEVRFIDHLADSHGVTDHFSLYLELHHDGKHPTCQCSPGCTEELTWNCWKKGFTSKFVRGHNAKLDSVWLDKERQQEFVTKRLEGYASGRIKVWNDGLTKETEPRIAEMAAKTSATLNEGYETGRLVDWRLLDPEKATEVAGKMSETKKAKFASGELKPWNEGLTKETDVRVAQAAAKITERYKHPDAGARIKLNDVADRIAIYADKFELVSPIEEYTKRRVAKLQFRCVAQGHLQDKSLAMLEESPVCYFCHPKASKAELEVLEFVRSLGVEALSGDRTAIAPLELDVYVPSLKLGIEYNVLYYHSTHVIKDKDYHQRKLAACSAAGIKLFSIYEDEWRDRRTIIEGMLRHRLGLTSERLFARKLQLRQLTTTEARQFFDANHLEGYARCTASFGLVDSASQVVAGMSLRTAFHKRYADVYEVGRSCTLSTVSVSGGTGRLTRAAAEFAVSRGKRGLMTYVDARVGDGRGYAAAGWQCIRHDTGARFWWTDGIHRFNRFQFKADKVNGKTQKQVSDEAGVVPIFGCGNSIWQFIP